MRVSGQVPGIALVDLWLSGNASSATLPWINDPVMMPRRQTGRGRSCPPLATRPSGSTATARDHAGRVAARYHAARQVADPVHRRDGPRAGTTQAASSRASARRTTMTMAAS